jgi:hypothetical protein
MFWQTLTHVQKKQISESLQVVRDGHNVSFGSHENVDCQQLAVDLKECFKNAGWRVQDKLQLTGRWDTLGATGITLFGKEEKLLNAVSQAISENTQLPIRMQNDLPSESAIDISVLVGTKQLR